LHEINYDDKEFLKMKEHVILKLSPPWITYLNELEALFGGDTDVEICFDNKKKTVKLTVRTAEKCRAIDWLMPETVKIGAVTLQIDVFCRERCLLKEVTDCDKALFEAAFERNPAFAFAREVEDLFGNKFVYVVFKNRVVQFFNDNLGDIYGNLSMLYEQCARDVLDTEELEGVFFCTDVEEKVGKPLGEWP